jgi:26S proteasome regulatory subunit T4
MASDPEREQALEAYKKTLLDSREWEAKLKALRLDIKGLQHEFDVSEDNIKALQSVGQIIGEVLKQLDEERCELNEHSDTIWITGLNTDICQSL